MVLTGCSNPDVTVAHDVGEVSVDEGETLRVDFGEFNGSVGEAWYLAEVPDGTVLKALDTSSEPVDPDADEDEVGGSVYLSWDFEAVGAGETSLVFQYCMRSSLEECVGDLDGAPAPDPVELVVTVKSEGPFSD